MQESLIRMLTEMTERIIRRSLVYSCRHIAQEDFSAAGGNYLTGTGNTLSSPFPKDGFRWFEKAEGKTVAGGSGGPEKTIASWIAEGGCTVTDTDGKIHDVGPGNILSAIGSYLTDGPGEGPFTEDIFPLIGGAPLSGDEYVFFRSEEGSTEIASRNGADEHIPYGRVAEDEILDGIFRRAVSGSLVI